MVIWSSGRVFVCSLQWVFKSHHEHLQDLSSSSSLIDVTVFRSQPGRSHRFLAQRYCLCPFLQPHNINHSPLHLSNLQRHREQAGVQQERGCLLGTTGVCQLSGTCSGSPHSLPQPERKIGHSSHQPTGHTLHPAVPQVHSKTQHYTQKQRCLIEISHSLCLFSHRYKHSVHVCVYLSLTCALILPEADFLLQQK